jgi:RNA recognition motif-containing protein
VKLYVGNLPFDATEDEVRQMFEPHGALQSVSLVNDNMTGRFRGFGFVEMSDADAAKAIAALNGKDLRGRPLTVNESRPKTGGGRGGDRGGRGGGRREYSGGGGGGRW